MSAAALHSELPRHSFEGCANGATYRGEWVASHGMWLVRVESAHNLKHGVFTEAREAYDWALLQCAEVVR